MVNQARKEVAPSREQEIMSPNEAANKEMAAEKSVAEKLKGPGEAIEMPSFDGEARTVFSLGLVSENEFAVIVPSEKQETADAEDYVHASMVNTVTAEQASVSPTLVLESRDRRDSFDKIVDSTAIAAGVDENHTEVIKTAAKMMKNEWMRQAGQESDPGKFLAEKIKELVNTDEETIIHNLTTSSERTLTDAETARREAEQKLAVESTPDATAQAETARIEASAEAGRFILDSKKDNARAEGFVELMNSPLYKEGAEATRNRINEIENQMRQWDTTPDSDRTKAQEIAINELWAERKRHMAILPTLEKFEGLEKKVTEVTEAVDQEHQSKLEELTANLRSVWGKIGNRVARMNALNSTVERLNGFIEQWENHPAATEAEEEMSGNKTRLETLQQEISRLRDEEKNLQEAGVMIEYDVDGTIEPVKTELYNHLMDLAINGEADDVGDYIEGRLDEENLSDAERDILKKTLSDIDNRIWMDNFEAPMGLEIGNKIKLEIGRTNVLGAEIVGFTPDKKIQVKLENGAIRSFDSKFVVKLDEKTKIDGESEAAVTSNKAVENFTEEEKVWFAEEPEATSAEVMAAAAEVNMDTSDFEKMKLVFETVKGIVTAEDQSMDLYDLPETWAEFVSLQKKADSGFFKRMFGGKSEMQKGMEALGEAYMKKVAGSAGLSEGMRTRLERQQEKLRSSGVDSVWNIKF
jgi:hypothetical protein